MRRNLLLMLFFFVILAGCYRNDASPWHSMIQYDWRNFDNKKIPELEKMMSYLSIKYDMEIFRKDRSQLAYVSGGKAAFYNTLDHNGHTVVDATNAGVAHNLSVMAVDYGDFPEKRLVILYCEVVRRVGDIVNGDPNVKIVYGDKGDTSGSVFEGIRKSGC